jgi:aminopeptidase N
MHLLCILLLYIPLYHDKHDKHNSAEVGRRRLRNTVLDYIHSLKDDTAAELCLQQYNSADCMTDKVAALSCLADIPGDKVSILHCITYYTILY